jgi:hypothetical protein
LGCLVIDKHTESPALAIGPWSCNKQTALPYSSSLKLRL